MNRGNSGSMVSSCCTSELTDEKLNKDRQTSASRSCPSCGHSFDSNPDMIGLPTGVKFDPSDQELIEHLESMVKNGGSRAHPLIDDFIPTIKGDDGICYTHPENLPGVTRDGLTKHFFHRTSKAYTTGTRKRRKIQSSDRGLQSGEDVAEARWHKTGKTRPVIVGGQQKGCKKILVLYINYGKQGKPEKTNWVMHQYHLGDQEEQDGQLVVSKVFYQTQLRSGTAMVEQHTGEGENVAEASEAMQNVLPGCAADATAATVAMVPQRQQKRQRQATDRHCSFAPSKMSHEIVAVSNHVSRDQEDKCDNHHIPSQQHVRSNLHAKSVPTMSFHVGTPSNTVSTAISPEVQHSSLVLASGSRFCCPSTLHRNEKNQEHQQQKGGRRSAEKEELIIDCQSASTEAGASTQSKEVRRPYHLYWPPDRNQDQHQLQCS